MIRDRRFPALAAAFVTLAAASAFAEEAPSADAAAELRRRMEALERRHREEMESLRREMERLLGAPAPDAAATPPRPAFRDVEEVLDDYLARLEEVERRVDVASTLRAPGHEVDFSLGILGSAGASSAPESALAALFPHHHDPRGRGFTVQNVVLAAAAEVDPYLRGEVHVVWTVDEDGGTTVELEEAFAETTSLPAGFRVKAGQFFTGFGRQNVLHAHAWEFADAPVVATRMFGGDGMRGPGVQASWLAPTGFPLEFALSAQNANGETMSSFLSDELPGGRPDAGRSVRSLADLAYTARAQATASLGEHTVLLVGASCATGPNSTGPTGRTRLLGADVTLRWSPSAHHEEGPFVAWTTEAMHRRYHADAFLEPASGLGFHPHAALVDRGAYSQVVWGFARGWTAGLRADWADGSGGGHASDALRDRRTRGSLALTWSPSAHGKLRLQVSRDRSQAFGRAFTSVFLQLEVRFGAHDDHP